MATQTVATVSNPYGISGTWAHGGVIIQFVMVVLFLLSFVSWYVIVTKLWDQRKVRQAARQAEKQFWAAPSLKEGVEKLKKGSQFRTIAEEGLRAVSHHEGRLTDRIDLHEWVSMTLQRSVEQVSSELQKGLSILATIGSSSVYVGLFGTVWGVMNALIAIGLAGQASIGKVAGPVGGALITTALGLFAAVPAVWGYNWLLGRNKVLQDAVRNFASDLHAYLVSGARLEPTTGTSGGGGRPVAAPAAAAARK